MVGWRLDRLARPMKPLSETVEGITAAKARGRQGGRPPKLTPQDLAAARAMLADTSFTVADVALRLGVSPATLYRHLPAARSQLAQHSD